MTFCRKILNGKVLFFILLIGVLLNAGWFFVMRPASFESDIQCVTGNGRNILGFTQVPGNAVSAGMMIEEKYLSEGWQAAPVCTPTFKLFMRGADMAFVLTEDASAGGAVITEFRQRNSL